MVLSQSDIGVAFFKTLTLALLVWNAGATLSAESLLTPALWEALHHHQQEAEGRAALLRARFTAVRRASHELFVWTIATTEWSYGKNWSHS